jgi:hypothetical protein
VVALPTRLARRYLVLRHKGVLLAGTLVFVIEALSANLSRSLGHGYPRPSRNRTTSPCSSSTC